MLNRMAFFVGLLALAPTPAAFAAGAVPTAAPATITAPLVATSGNAPLRPLVRVRPKYPPRAQISGYEGSVNVCFTVKADGSVADAAVKSFVPRSATSITAAPAAESVAVDVLGAAAITAVSQWKFSPRKKNGKAVVTKGVCQTFGFMIGGSALPPNIASVEKAAVAGSASAQARLANFYLIGWGVEKDYRKAAEWVGYAARQGNASAERMLGNMYLDGHGVPQDDEKGASLLRKSADQGDPSAEYMLGMLYGLGRGVKRDYGQSAAWLRKAAASNFAWAEIALGMLYSRGEGVPKNNVTAVEWFRKAAVQGDSYGELMLGWQYLDGSGVPQSAHMAVYWFRLAAEAGNAHAAVELARLYEQGEGVIKDCAQAFYWYSKAADAGNDDAKKALLFFGKEKGGACYAHGA